MKRKDEVKSILMKALRAFPIGVTLLMLLYASVYFISGEGVFNAELYQLHNINTLIYQIISVGMAGCILSICFQVFQNIENKPTDKHTYRVMITSILLSISITIIILILGNEKIFSENIATLNVIVFVIIYVLAFLRFCIKKIMEQNLIKKINQKIKERNC